MRSTFFRIAAILPALFILIQFTTAQPSPYGSIYNKNTWSNTSDFITKGNTTATLSGNYINITSATADDWNNIINITSYQTKLEKWQFKMRFKIVAWAGNSYGIGFGLKSANAYVQNDIMGFIQTSNTGNGGLYILKSGRTIVATGPSIGVALNDIIDLDGTFYDSVFHLTAHNITSGATGTVSFTYATNGSTIVVPNTSNFSLMELGGTHQIQNIDISSQELIDANLVTVGDSKTIGYFTNTFTGRYASQLNNNYPSALINAGGADLTTNVLNRQDELIRLSANKYLLSIGSNDIRFGSSLAQLQTNYDSLVRILQATGAKVYHIVLPEDYTKPLGVNLLSFKDWVQTNYPAYYINVWDSMATGNILKGIYDTGDGVHLNQLGNNKIYQAIVASNKLNDVVLPVGLLFFTVEQKGNNQVNISWKTGADQHSATYIVLKSSDGINFEQLGSVPSNAVGSYNYIDNNFITEINYYKLKIIESPGFEWFSNTVAVRKGENAPGISGMQKISETEYIFTYNSTENSIVGWQVIDVNGRKLGEGKQQLYKGNNNIKIAISNYSNGVYYLKILSPNKHSPLVFAFFK